MAILALAAVTFGFGGEAGAQDVCRGGSHSGSGPVSCVESSGSTADITIDLKGVDISTTANSTHGVNALHAGGEDGSGNIDIDLAGDSRITTSGDDAIGIYGVNGVEGSLEITVLDSTIETQGLRAHGISAERIRVGGIVLQVERVSVTTSGIEARGIDASNASEGNDSVQVKDSEITTSGDNAYGIYIFHSGFYGETGVQVEGGSVTTSGTEAHGIFALVLHRSSVDIQILKAAEIRASGVDAHGVQAGLLDENGDVEAHGGFDEEGYRLQKVTVGSEDSEANGYSEVYGGSGDGAGIFLAGGGRVAVGPHGRVGADSGVAILADGDDPDSNVEYRLLHVDLMLGGRDPDEVLLQGGRIVNDGGHTTVVVNEVLVYDTEAGGMIGWVPNGGVWDVTAQEAAPQAAQGGIEVVQAYAPRAALYESLPGVLLRLDAGAPVRRPQEPVWARLEYGTGSGDPERSRAGASYDFDRGEAAAGISRSWEGGLGGSLWLRRVRSEVKVDSPGGASELELHGVGAGVAAHWIRGDGLEVSGEVSLTDFDVDADSSRHGSLAKDVGAELWQAKLEVGRRMQQASGLSLFPRVWAWHAEADIDDFTDAVRARVSYADESRTGAGLGLLAEVTQSGYTVYGSLDVESLFSGEETAVEVSGHELGSESERTRVLAGVGGSWQGRRMSLRGGLRLSDPGGGNQEVSASFSIGGSF